MGEIFFYPSYAHRSVHKFGMVFTGPKSIGINFLSDCKSYLCKVRELVNQSRDLYLRKKEAHPLTDELLT